MSPSSTLRLRRVTAALAVAWGLFAIGASGVTLVDAGEEVAHPFWDSRLGGSAVIQSLHPSAVGRGAEPGDHILTVNGEPFFAAAARARDNMEVGELQTYGIRKPDGRELEVRLPAIRDAEIRTDLTVLIQVLMTTVAVIYLAIGGTVWWLRPGRSGAWALLLFCSTMATQLAMMMHTDFLAWSWPRTVINLPLMGATAFHLFTTYPLEPDWIVRHRRIQVLPYGAALGLIVLGFSGDSSRITRAAS